MAKKHNTKVLCMFCFQDFTIRKKQRAQPHNHSKNSNTQNDLYMCPSCEAQQIVNEFENSFIDSCYTCGFKYNIPGTCACLTFLHGKNFKLGYDMLYCHYEIFQLPIDVGNMPAGSNMMRFKFSSSTLKASVLNFKRDGDVMKRTIELIKQIPTGKRSYDPATNIWTIPLINKTLIDGMIFSQFISGGSNINQVVIEHPDLDQFINPPIQNTESKNTWSQTKVKVENPEDFFYKAPTILSEPDIKMRLIEITKPYLSLPPTMDEVNKEWFMRAYKITARKLHPDLNPDPSSAKKMSELNELWTQYKELVS